MSRVLFFLTLVASQHSVTQNCSHLCAHTEAVTWRGFLVYLGDLHVFFDTKTRIKGVGLWVVSLPDFEAHWWIISQDIPKGRQDHRCACRTGSKRTRLHMFATWMSIGVAKLAQEGIAKTSGQKQLEVLSNTLFENSFWKSMVQRVQPLYRLAEMRVSHWWSVQEGREWPGPRQALWRIHMLQIFPWLSLRTFKGPLLELKRHGYRSQRTISVMNLLISGK